MSPAAAAMAFGGAPSEQLTARGTIIHNLKTIQTKLDVKTFLWYLVDKVSNTEKMHMSVYHLYTTFKVCQRTWSRSGRVSRIIGKSKRRFTKWSSIITLMKAKINSDMLVQRLLNSE